MNRSDFPLIIIGMFDYVEGATRLQKYGFLLHMKIKELEKAGFYNDWEASNFGPFSKQLAMDVTKSVSSGIVKTYHIKNRYDFYVDRFALSDGKEKLKIFSELHPSIFNKMKEILTPYQTKTLQELLQDVYYQYPQFTNASKIKAEIGKKIYESDSYLSTMYDEPDM